MSMNQVPYMDEASDYYPSRAWDSPPEPAAVAAKVAEIEHSQQLYQNPFVNMAYTFMEPLPVGLIITLISAAVLRRKGPGERVAAPAVITT